MRLAYADPPYPGCAHLYRKHPDFEGEVDHAQLVQRLCDEYDGWVLHTASTTLAHVLPLVPDGTRIGAWVKTFASYKPNLRVAYAWEPVLFSPARVESSRTQATIVDWLPCPIELRKGLAGAKPPEVIRWTFALMAAQADDTLDDLFPGTGVVERTWRSWCSYTTIPIRERRPRTSPLFEGEA